MARIISLLNHKGGVGKTTTTLNLGASLAAAGSRVLLVDADPQASLTQVLIGPNATDRLDPKETVASLFGDRARPKKLARATELPGLSLWRGSAALANHNAPLPQSQPRDEQRALEYAIGDVAADFDWILIDCAPSLQLVTWAALLASDGVIVPIQPETLSTQGINPVRDIVEAVQAKPNRRLALLGYLVSMYDHRGELHRSIEKGLREGYGSVVFEAVVPMSFGIKNATVRSLPIVATNPRSKAAAAYRAIAVEVTSRMESVESRRQVVGVA